jgi:hypothetical protein
MPSAAGRVSVLVKADSPIWEQVVGGDNQPAPLHFGTVPPWRIPQHRQFVVQSKRWAEAMDMRLPVMFLPWSCTDEQGRSSTLTMQRQSTAVWRHRGVLSGRCSRLCSTHPHQRTADEWLRLTGAEAHPVVRQAMLIIWREHVISKFDAVYGVTSQGMPLST